MDEKVTNSAYEYLYATIQMADWISEEYKKIAEHYKNHQALKELYLCICDGVSPDLLEVFVIDKDIEEVLRKCRKKHLESDFLRKYSDAVERISVITAKTEHEVKNMSTTVKFIADSIPVKRDRNELPEPIIVKEESIISNQLEKRKEEQSPVFKPDNELLKQQHEKTINLDDSKKISRKEKFTKPIEFIINKYIRNPRRTVVDMLSQGYSDEQISFIYSCIEEGMTSKEIDKFASPKINVETMKQLKKVVLKEREKNG